MVRHRARRLGRRLFTLLVLVAALAALSANPPRQKATAAIPVPCTYCENMFDNCLSNCGTLGDPFACHSQCAARYDACISNCS